MPKRVLEPEHFPFFDYKRYSFSMGLETDEGIWLSGHTAARHSPEVGDMVVEGDIVAQSRLAYEKIGAVLAAAGRGLRDIARTVEYVKADALDEYARTAALRRELFGDQPPVVNVIPVNRLLRPTASIEIEAFASSKPSRLIETAQPIDSLHRARARRVGDLLYVTTQLPVTSDEVGAPAVVAAGDLLGQTRRIYENTGEILGAAGLGWNSVIKTVEFVLRPALPRYKESGAVRREFLGPRFPVATGILAQRLPVPDALIQVDFVASYLPKRGVNPGWARYSKLTYEAGVRTGNLLVCSGQGSIDLRTEQIVYPNDIVAQTRHVYGNILKVVEAAGGGPENVVKTVEYITPAALPRYRETAALRQEIFPAPYPAATGVVVEALLYPELEIEIDAWVVLP